MAKDKTYSVFVDLNPDDDVMGIPIIHTYVDSVSAEDAVKLVLCSLSASTLKNGEAKVAVMPLSKWKTRKIRCEIKPHQNNGECDVQ